MHSKNQSMLTLFALAILSILTALVASQNTTLATISIMDASFSLPVWMIGALGALLGLTVSGIMSTLGSISNAFTLRGKDQTIRAYNKQIRELQSKIEDLESENDRLKINTDDTSYQPTIRRPILATH